MVLGARDQGKSTFCRYLAGRLSDAGHGVRLLDTDVGQKLVGPPACITLARAGSSGLVLDRLRFVGETNPVSSMPGVIAAAARLSAAADAPLVINTSGLISGPGLTLKRWKIEALAPEWIVAIAAGLELEPVLAALPPERVLRLRPSPHAARKPDGARAGARVRALSEALSGAIVQPLGAQHLEELLRAPPAPETPRLCGLSDDAGEDLGLGMIFGASKSVLTRVDLARVWRVRLGMAAPPELTTPESSQP